MLSAPVSRLTSLPRRERILGYGPAKAGKTSCWVTIAKWAQDTGSSAQFFVIDTDCTVEPMLSGSAYGHLENIVLRPCYGYEAMAAAGKEFSGDVAGLVQGSAGPGDWIVVDMGNAVWSATQNYFSQLIHGMDPAKRATQLRAAWDGEGKAAGDIEGWDWGYVNRLYDDIMKPILFGNHGAHVFICTEASELNSKLEKDPEKKRMFHSVGYKPAGQKSLAYQVNTILFVDKRASGRYITTVGDREREWLKEATLNDFVLDYLIPVCQWTDE